MVPKVTKKLMEVKAVSTPEERSSLMAILESVYRCATCYCKLLAPHIDVRFALGSVAGAAGATAVYPIDLV